jgi:hypothetical protein
MQLAIDPLVNLPHQQPGVELLGLRVTERPADSPRAECFDDGLELQSCCGQVIFRRRRLGPGQTFDDAAFSRSRRRDDSSEREIPGSPRSIALKRWLPSTSSRTMSGVHRSARISVALATGQYCWYFCWRILSPAAFLAPVRKSDD